MTPRRWLALLAFYISYLLFGASIYYHIENQLEIEKRAEALQQRMKIYNLLISNLAGKDETITRSILEQVSDYCEKPVTNHTEDEFEEPFRWTFYHSLFFAFTVCSTVGYGNLAPSTTLGQMIMIIYSLIGIPINGILFAGLGEFFSRTFTRIYQRYKNYKMSNDDMYVPRQFGLVATVLIALVPGITFFIVLPAVLFSYFEGWPYTLSIYFSYVTTSTIGFGDYVPTFQPDGERKFGIKFIFYQAFIIIWFIFSLGYLLMIMTFITKGLRSKKLAHLENQLSMNIKATQHRIWTGVTKDVGYLRRILNELYIMKFKPCRKKLRRKKRDKHPINLVPRSASCPNLTIYRVETPIIARKRAFSENYEFAPNQDLLERSASEQSPMVRVSSESDLEKINKEKTFDSARAFMQTTDLLARVVTALGNIRPAEKDTIHESLSGSPVGGYHGLTDSQILASEKTWSGWSEQSIENAAMMMGKRERAASDFFLSPITIPQANNEWTWAGENTQIQQVINDKMKAKMKKRDLYRASFQTPDINRSVILNMNDVDTKAPVETKPDQKNQTDKKTILKRITTFKKSASSDGIKVPSSVLDQETKRNLDKLSQRKGSGISISRQYQHMPSSNHRPSLFSMPSQEQIDQEVLENTTIADLIRALEIMHTHSNLQGSPDDQSGPKRKMGTASLTPPALPPLFTLFAQNTSEPASVPNYARRATMFSVPTNHSPQQTMLPRMSVRLPSNPPPYTEAETQKFRRRFSIRPTNLQIPPGMAPSVNRYKMPSSQATVQTSLQRRLSLRPSPLARDVVPGRSILSRQIPSQPGSGRGTTTPSRTHSPLSRIAQMQASRRGTVGDLNLTDRKKTDSK